MTSTWSVGKQHRKHALSESKIDILAIIVISKREVWAVVFNATFNNISTISWRSVLLVEETGVPRENRRTVASHWQTLSHNVVSIYLIVVNPTTIGS